MFLCLGETFYYQNYCRTVPEHIDRVVGGYCSNPHRVAGDQWSIKGVWGTMDNGSVLTDHYSSEPRGRIGLSELNKLGLR